MIQASKFLKDYVEQHGSNEILAKRWNTTRQTVFNIMNDKHNISSDMIEMILKDTGFEFAKAFEVKE